MPAQESALPLSLVIDGKYGVLFWGGLHLIVHAISAGQKPLDLNYSSDLSSALVELQGTTSYMVTTKELLKDGGMGIVVTPPSMVFSNVFKNSSDHWRSSTQPMSLVPKIQLTVPPMASIHHTVSSYPPCPSPSVSKPSLLTVNLPSPQQSCVSIVREPILSQHPSLLPTEFRKKTHNNNSPTPVFKRTIKLWVSRFGSLPTLPQTPVSNPQPYKIWLTPKVSSLHPHCAAAEWLQVWRPLLPG